MLKSLHIANYALIESLEIEFASGLNILTGETGAGKSIIIDALSLILGERADSEVVRRGAEKAIVETVFGVVGNQKLKAILGENDIECGDDLILRREVSAKGQGRCFINDSPVTLSLMKDVGDVLVDLHGQHEHQSLLRVETHGDLLDDFGKLDGLREEFRRAYERALAARAELEQLRAQERHLRERMELYDFQVKEIDAVGPRQGEEETLENELRVLENAEKLFEATSRLYGALYEGENSVNDQLVLARNMLEDLAAIDSSFNEARSECASAVAIVGEMAKFIQQYNSRIEFNPERLEQTRTRLGQISLLKKKYGGSLDLVLAHREKIGKELALAENFDATIGQLQQRFEKERRGASEIAQRLSAKRREVAKRIDKLILDSLAELGIPKAQFLTGIEHRVSSIENPKSGGSNSALVRLGRDLYQTTPKGIDFVEFHISTNVGEDPKPLAKVASGGEISRIMLALKNILAKSDRLPLLVFDEIDVGISGRIAQAVGRSLKNLSQFHQIIAITHLPQIAGMADEHYVVEKVEDGKRAATRIRRLNLDERVREVATLMSGVEITDAGLAGAKELMGLG